MTYSCAYFEDKNQSLNEAQESKYDILCRKLKIQESDTVLEIGSGWEGLQNMQPLTMVAQLKESLYLKNN